MNTLFQELADKDLFAAILGYIYLRTHADEILDGRADERSGLAQGWFEKRQLLVHLGLGSPVEVTKTLLEDPDLVPRMLGKEPPAAFDSIQGALRDAARATNPRQRPVLNHMISLAELPSLAAHNPNLLDPDLCRAYEKGYLLKHEMARETMNRRLSVCFTSYRDETDWVVRCSWSEFLAFKVDSKRNVRGFRLCEAKPAIGKLFSGLVIDPSRRAPTDNRGWPGDRPAPGDLFLFPQGIEGAAIDLKAKADLAEEGNLLERLLSIGGVTRDVDLDTAMRAIYPFLYEEILLHELRHCEVLLEGARQQDCGAMNRNEWDADSAVLRGLDLTDLPSWALLTASFLSRAQSYPGDVAGFSYSRREIVFLRALADDDPPGYLAKRSQIDRERWRTRSDYREYSGWERHSSAQLYSLALRRLDKRLRELGV